MSILVAYDPDARWGRAFGVVDYEVYSPPLYMHRGQDIRKLAPGGGYSVVTDVLSLSPGVVSHIYRATATGLEVVVDTGRPFGRGRYEIHCHSAVAASVGTPLEVGSYVCRNAGWGEAPGTGWSGPHDHFVISDFPDAAHTPSRPVYDPRPFILNALSAASGGGGTPLPAPVTPEEEEDDMPRTSGFSYTRSADKVNVFLIVNYGSGAYHEYSGTDGGYNNAVAAAFDTNSFAKITEGHANVIKASCERLLKR